ncbi:MAG: DegT/DnrJ/EryC1/StrS family aminotransferase [Myxococcales bacterium]|nr:DegT/DnrJ/EryC1/StrS family aminotransferase [Myxococcales bacterium]
MPAVVDLRSDTVTKPTAAMRLAMSAAEVGDDVYDEDPTVNALQARVAALLGKEAALFMPSGTMANQVALRSLTVPGDEVMIGQNAHVWLYESGALAALAGVQTCPLPGGGLFGASEVRAAHKPDTFYLSPTTVLAVENTHNAAGGAAWSLAALREVTATARTLGMRTHLDGARLWNAAVATGHSEAELCEGFDTVTVALSKGLGAPIGSVLASTRERITRCRRLRKMYGGGMRQVGILAAAGLYALEHHRARLADDHRRASAIASALAEAAVGKQIRVSTPQTNIVLIRGALDIVGVVAAARAQGVLIGAPTADALRLITHLDVDDAGLAHAIAVLKPLLHAS